MDSDQATRHLPAPPTSQRETISPRKQIAAILARLSFHYWRPDYSPEQARMVMEDYLDDLAGHDPTAVERACIEYRKNPENKFFPKSGELLGLLRGPDYLNVTSYRGLPTWTTPKYLLEPPRGKTKSVAEVLRDTGNFVAAEKWEARTSSSPKGGSPT